MVAVALLLLSLLPLLLNLLQPLLLLKFIPGSSSIPKPGIVLSCFSYLTYFLGNLQIQAALDWSLSMTNLTGWLLRVAIFAILFSNAIAAI